jgi:hypothetical protein
MTETSETPEIPASSRWPVPWEQAWVRVLIPFTFREPSSPSPRRGADLLERAAQSLSADQLSIGADSSAKPGLRLWRRGSRKPPEEGPACRPHGDYLRDYLDPVRQFLFDGDKPTGCLYWSVDPTIVSLWFNKTRVFFTRQKDAQVIDRGLASQPGRDSCDWIIDAVPDSGVEFFLTRMGVGVLSISLRLEPPSGVDDAARTNFLEERRLLHELATGQQTVWFWRPGFMGYPVEDQPEGTRELPTPDLDVRLRNEGHAFTWHELIERLLRPLRTTFAIAKETRFLLNLAVQLAAECDLEDPATRAAVIGQLSQVAQLHSSTHPGEITGHAQSLPVFISRKHVATLTLAGAAHAVARQRPYEEADEHPYDVEHLRRAHFSYFVSWLLAVIQRSTLQKTLEDGLELLRKRGEIAHQLLAGGTVGEGGTSLDPSSRQTQDQLNRRLNVLRWDLLAFSLQGEFVQVSHRMTVQQFHQAAQKATQIPEGLRAARRTISDWENAQRAEDTANLAGEVAESVHAMKHMQGNLEWVEVVLFSVYLIEVGHVMGEMVFGHTWILAASLVTLGLAGMAAAYLLLQPHRHAPQGRRLWTLMAFLVLALVVFLGVNLIWNRRTETHPVPAAPPATSHHGAGDAPAESQSEGPRNDSPPQRKGLDLPDDVFAVPESP